MVPVTTIHQHARDMPAGMKGCPGNSLMVVVNVSYPMSIYLVDPLVLYYSQYLNIQFFGKLNLKGIKIPTDQFGPENCHCYLPFIQGSFICTDDLVVLILETGVCSYIGINLVAGGYMFCYGTAASQFNIVKMRTYCKNVHRQLLNKYRDRSTPQFNSRSMLLR